jgi:hypothetical protein
MEQNFQFSSSNIQDKPMLLKAVEIILANPDDIKKQIHDMENQYDERYGNKNSKEKIRDLMCEHIIDNYSYYTAFAGGVAGLVGVVPGLGTVVAGLGGGAADAALSMKWQIEMVMAIATIYGRDIMVEDEKLLCFMVAGLGTINEFGKQGAKAMGSKAFCNMIKQYLKGSVLLAVKQVFKKLGIVFTKKAVVKFAPFGIGVIIGASANKVLTKYVGSKAKDFYSPHSMCADEDIEDELA